MAKTTTLFTVIPWTGGINTSKNEGLINADELVKGQNLVFDTDLSRKKRDGIDYDWDSGTSDVDSVLSLNDFWFGLVDKTHLIVGVTSGKEVYSYTSSGTRSADLFAGTAWASDITIATQTTFNNLDIIGVDGAGNVLKKWSGTGNIADLGGTPPEASMTCEHIGRLWANDKTRVDRIHYSETGDPEIWNGTGDSGGFDVRSGDGDSAGITAIIPFKGDLIVFKRTKIYRIIGDAPETFEVVKISDSIGCVGPNAVADVDGNDIIFVSDRGVHSLVATDQFGDLSQTFVSLNIQRTFNNDFTKGRLRFCQVRYLPRINSVGIAITDEKVSDDENNCIWFYNIIGKAWYKWHDVSCESLVVVNDADQFRYYLGSNTTRVGKAFTGNRSDIDESGTDVGISYIVETGYILVDKNPLNTKLFKSVGILYTAEGQHQITMTVKIDNYAPQTFIYTQNNSSDLLGISFILNQSALGQSNVIAPFMKQVDGQGRYIKVTLEQSGTDEEVDIQGLLIEYDIAGVQYEVIAPGDV